MKLLKTRRLFRNKGMPSYLVYIVTAKCNARCKFCFYWQNIDNFSKNSHMELKIDEIKKFATGLEKLQYVTLGGGEPFTRDDLHEICKIFHDTNDVQQITIPTNGILTERIISQTKKMLENCPNTFFRISLSLDAVGEEHDKLRNVKAFANLVKTYKELSKLREGSKRLNVDISSVFSAFNQDSFKGLIDYVNENFDVDNHNIIFVRGDTREKTAKDVSLEKYREVKKYYESIRKRDENRPFSRVMRAMYDTAMENIEKTAKDGKCVIPCRSVISHLISVDEIGDVYPCELLPGMKLGNLRDFDFNIRKILNTEKTKKIKEKIIKDKCYCTWECAMNANLLYDMKSYPKLMGRALKSVVKK